MDTVNHNREEPVRRPRQEGTAAPRNQIGGEEAKRRPRPNEAKRRSSPEAGTAPKRRTEPEREAAAKRPRPESGERETANSQRKTSGQAGEASRQRREASPSSGQRKTTPAQKAAKPAAKGKTAGKASKEQPRKPARRREPADDLSTKKRAYGNSKPKKPSALAVLGQAISATAKEGAAKHRARQERQGKRSKNEAKQPLPAVIYTQPQAFNRDRLLVQLITVTAVVVAVVVGLSVFFKVKNIRVSGAEVYTAWAVQEASGIQEGDSLLTFSRTRAGAQIQANLPYVKNVSFGIRLPDTVNIIIEEESVVYAIKDQDEQWWLINSEGFVVEQAQKGQASNYTQILGVALDHPLKEELAVAAETQVAAPITETDPTSETTETVVPVTTVSGEQKLSIALQIVQALEDNDIVGEAASINLSQTQSITLWYGTRYQINLGDSSNLEYKIACMNSVIMNMQNYDSGVLDCSFTVWPDRVGYTPFS